MRSILITRPIEDSIKTKKKIEDIGGKVYIEPMLSVEYLSVNIKLDKYELIISTSSHSLIALSKLTNIFNKRVITVGSHSMKVGRDCGFLNIFSINGVVQDIIDYIRINCSKRCKILYVRGQTVTCDLKKILVTDGFCVEEVIVYKTIESKFLSKKCQRLIFNSKIDGILFYSIRTAEVFLNLLKDANLHKKMDKVVVYALSNNIAMKINEILWKDILISEKPTQNSLISLINKHILIDNILK